MPLRKSGEPHHSSWMFAFYFLFTIFTWALIAAFWQGGWAGLGAFLKAYGILALAGVLVAAAYNGLREGPVTVLTGAGLLLLVAWLWVAGSWADWPWYLGAAVLAVAATILVLEVHARYFARETATKLPKHLDFLIMISFFWAFSSIGVSFSSTPLPTNPARFADLGPARSIVPEAASRWSGLRVGLALSGGGYRAAVFHAGVLQGLEDLGIRVNNLSTVSGGSIIGAYYAVGGDPRDFAQAVAEGRFNLKRSLLQFHNAARLPLPAKIPGLETRLFPWASFDRLDVQSRLLHNVLFDRAKLKGGLGDDEMLMGQPLLMIGVTDLSYGFQLGLLPDGLLKLGHAGNREVYRNDTLKVFDEFDLAERVALSGAFPLAFPPRRLKVVVNPIGATGKGTRELLLTDGGVRDNTGHDLLRVASQLSQKPGDPPEVADYRMPEEWSLDVTLVSDAGAVFGVLEERGSALDLLPRSFDVAAVETDHRRRPSDPCEALPLFPTRFAAADYFLKPDSQFNLKNDSVRRAALERETQIGFNPAWYPPEVLRSLVEHLPEPKRDQAQAKLDEFLTLWDTHEVRGQRWARAFRDAQGSAACEPTQLPRPGATPLVPGACEAVALRELVIEAITPDLETFRAASTLDDTPSRETVLALERLGRLVVYLRWPILEKNLDDGVACKDRGSDVPDTGQDDEHPSPVVGPR